MRKTTTEASTSQPVSKETPERQKSTLRECKDIVVAMSNTKVKLGTALHMNSIKHPKSVGQCALMIQLSLCSTSSILGNL